MTLTSMHTHTEWCDGRGTVEDFCRAAVDRGFAAIGFSAHAPVEHAGLSTAWHLPEKKIVPYLDAVREAKRRWAGKLAVFAGLEVDYIEGRMGPAGGRYRRMGLDFVIGSVHYVPNPSGGEILAVDGPPDEFAVLLGTQYRGDAAALTRAYWTALSGMIQAGGFDILGHMDLIKVNNRDERYFSLSGAEYRALWRPLLPLLASGGFTVEVNTGGLNRGRTNYVYPSGEILAALGDLRVPFVITSDAHEPGHLGGHYETARRVLLEAGCPALRVFTGRTAAGALWREEPLTAESPS
ncbi:MAG: histidinol-phosphatase [Spirochaetaceae bacterium]|jgi:histidinol-phosphatase (PHP family)|nr:histidinol-phosphatase [Spirochaetaceae bacterium]